MNDFRQKLLDTDMSYLDYNWVLETCPLTLCFKRDWCWKSFYYIFTIRRFLNPAWAKCFSFIQYWICWMDVILLCSRFNSQRMLTVTFCCLNWTKWYHQMSFRGFCYKGKNLLALELNAWTDQSVINGCWNESEHPFPLQCFQTITLLKVIAMQFF